jgi:hypothetical protein
MRLGAHLADVPCVALGSPTCGRALSLHCGRALGRLTCAYALRCVGAPNLRICLALRYIGVPNLRTCRRALRLRCGCELGAQLADVPCIALG